MARELRNNIRSFRYSDRVAEILESVEGDSLNDKFNNLVITAYDALPAVQNELEMAQRLLRTARKEYYDLVSQSREVGRFLRQVGTLDSQVKALQQSLERAGCNTDSGVGET